MNNHSVNAAEDLKFKETTTAESASSHSYHQLHLPTFSKIVFLPSFIQLLYLTENKNCSIYSIKSITSPPGQHAKPVCLKTVSSSCLIIRNEYLCKILGSSCQSCMCIIYSYYLCTHLFPHISACEQQPQQIQFCANKVATISLNNTIHLIKNYDR